MSVFSRPLISSIVGTRGSFLGSFGEDTSFAGFWATMPSRPSHLYIDRKAASARATETLLSPQLCRCERNPRIVMWSISFQRASWLHRRADSLSSRMKLSIDRLQPVQRHMGINLAGGNIGMAQDRLHR